MLVQEVGIQLRDRPEGGEEIAVGDTALGCVLDLRVLPVQWDVLLERFGALGVAAVLELLPAAGLRRAADAVPEAGGLVLLVGVSCELVPA